VIDAVLSHHMNPLGRGVAKFNAILAKRLGVPMKPLNSACDYPLVSIKVGELPPKTEVCDGNRPFDAFLHDWDIRAMDFATRARRVFAGNRVIADQVRKFRPDVVTAHCPSTISGNPSRGLYRVLVFGMAHKLHLKHFENLKLWLDGMQPGYTVELSTAVHEGHPWDEALAESVAAMRAIFGDKLRVLGFLGDDALARVLQEVDAVACYFTPALRENNTSYWSAVAAGKTIFTNRDEHSPKEGDEPASWESLVELIRA
jgi:hypothetical protein